MSIFDGRSTGTSGGDRTPLPTGVYASQETIDRVKKKSPDTVGYPNTRLKLTWYGTKDIKGGKTRHSYLATAEGATAPDGGAFLKIDLKPEWADDAIVAVAMGWAEKMVEEKALTTEQVKAAEANILNEAAELIKANNVPEDRQLEELDNYIENIKTQIRINYGRLFDLQDWRGKGRSLNTFSELVGTEFTGKVENTDFGSEVKAVYRAPKTK